MEELSITRRCLRRYTPEQRAAYVQQWKESGKSQRVFSEEQGVSYTSLNNWIRIEKKRQAKKPAGFVAVKVKPVNHSFGENKFAEVRTPEGFVFSLYKEVPAEYLRSIARR